MATAATAKPYHFTLSELRKLTARDLEELDRQEHHGRRWQEAVCWLGDYDGYRQRRIAEEARPTPKPPTHAPAIAASRADTPLTFKHGKAIARATGRIIKEQAAKLTERMETGDSRVLKLEALCHEQSRRIDELRVGLAEQQRRYDGQRTHLRNLETRITGEGRIEHGSRPRTEGSE